MTAVAIHPARSVAPLARGKMSNATPAQAVGVFRLPADPLYYLTLTLNNIVVGSRYRVTRASDGLELATGVAAATDEVIAGVPVYSSGMLMAIEIRKATAAPKYKPFSTFATAAPLGASAYILQSPDPIA